MFIVSRVKSFYFTLFDKVGDRWSKCKATSIVGIGGILVTGLVSFLA